MNDVVKAMKTGVEDGVFPGAVVLVSKDGRVRFFEAFGWAQRVPLQRRMTKGTIFDLSSLTKPVAAASAVMCLVRDRRVGLDDPIKRFLPVPDDKAAVTIRHLLSHTSGLPSWKPYYRRYRHYEIPFRILGEQLLFRPGSRALYSDPGFILLGRIVENSSGLSLDRFCRESVFGPLRMKDTSFHPPPKRCAATENSMWRHRVIVGDVHDENAWAMGRAAGHAGLFSTARNLLRFSEEIVDGYHGRGTLFPQRVVREFLRRPSLPGSTWALGWDTPTQGRSASGAFFSRYSVGHLGFTGTSLWIDLSRRIVVILLTNRIHPARKNEKIKKFRPMIHDLIMKKLVSW